MDHQKLNYEPIERAWNSASLIVDWLSDHQVVIHARRAVDGALCVLDAIIAGRNIRIMEVSADPQKLVFRFPPVTTCEAQTLREANPEFSLHRVSQTLLTRYASLTG
jgi:hypothetical protein